MTLYRLGSKSPGLARGAWVADSAELIGDVTLGEDASVWFGAVLRADCEPIVLGARTNLQDGSVVHITADSARTTVGDDVTVGHMVLLHGCTVGDRCLVGMGSIVLDHAVIASDCFIGAGSLVTPRTVIPPGSFVLGRPAKVVRPIRDEERQWIAESSRAYVAYKAMMARDLERIDR